MAWGNLLHIPSLKLHTKAVPCFPSNCRKPCMFHPPPNPAQLDWVDLYSEEVLWCVADTMGKIIFSSTL